MALSKSILKDLSKLGRDLTRTIIVDNIEENYTLQKDNGILIQTWKGNFNDRELFDIKNFLKETAMKGYQGLLTTSEDYRRDAKEIHDTMEHFAENSEMLKQVMDGIKDAIQAVNIAVEESAKGVVSTTETAVTLTENVGDIEQKADSNRQVAELLEAEVNKFKLE